MLHRLLNIDFPVRVRSLLLALVLLPVVGLGCTGAISGARTPGASASGGNGGASDVPAPPTGLPVEQACGTDSAGPTMLRRLSAAQFAATIVDLFQDGAAPVALVFNDPSVLGFAIDANALLVQGLNADQLMTNAEALATWAVANHLDQVTGCAATDADCPASFIRSFGRRAFRAPLSDASVAAYHALFSAETAFSDGVAAVIAAMLQSPRFLYRLEMGPPAAAPVAAGAPVALTPYEVASSLSYLLTGSTPDPTLMAAADAVAAGSLTTTEMIDQQFDRLLSDPRSQDALMDFMRSWLGLDRLYTTVKADAVFPLTNALRADMAGETRSLILDTFATGGGFSDLLTADHSFLNQSLAAYYGFDPTGLGDAFTRVPYPPAGASGRDGGLLAHAGILTGYARADVSSPTQRGHMVRTRLLCQEIMPPPPALDTTFKPEANPTTTRAHYEISHSVGQCAVCHTLMDKIGFGFEHYDAFGRWRDAEGPYPIDATGTIVRANATDGDVPFEGVGALESYLASNDDVKSCLVRYWSFYAYGSPSWAEDACTYAAIRQQAAAGSYGLREVLKAIVHAPHFTRREQP